jgi:hypothetical protein
MAQEARRVQGTGPLKRMFGYVDMEKKKGVKYRPRYAID